MLPVLPGVRKDHCRRRRKHRLSHEMRSSFVRPAPGGRCSSPWKRPLVSEMRSNGRQDPGLRLPRVVRPLAKVVSHRDAKGAHETPQASSRRIRTRLILMAKERSMTRKRRNTKSAKPKSTDPAFRGIPPVRADGTRDWGAMASRARREADRNTARVNEGETYRAGKRSTKEASPSSLRGGKYS